MRGVDASAIAEAYALLRDPEVLEEVKVAGKDVLRLPDPATKGWHYHIYARDDVLYDIWANGEAATELLRQIP
ncbi:hypothetical protein BH20CHL6_BH20CHL6_01880 [soil metagenome]